MTPTKNPKPAKKRCDLEGSFDEETDRMADLVDFFGSQLQFTGIENHVCNGGAFTVEPLKEMAISFPKPAYSKKLGSQEEVVPQDARSF